MLAGCKLRPGDSPRLIGSLGTGRRTLRLVAQQADSRNGWLAFGRASSAARRAA